MKPLKIPVRVAKVSAQSSLPSSVLVLDIFPFFLESLQYFMPYPKFLGVSNRILGFCYSCYSLGFPLSNQGISRIMSARFSQMARVSVDIEFLAESAVVEWVRGMVK